MANAADPRQVDYGRRKQKRQSQIYFGALAAVMDTPNGRLVLSTLMERAGVFESTFNQNALSMARDEGRREMGCVLRKELELVAPSLHTLLEAERRAREQADRRETQAVEQTAAQED